MGNLYVLSIDNLDFAKTKNKDTSLSSFHLYNANVSQNLCDKELEVLEKLSENNDLVVQKGDKGNSVVLTERDVMSVIWKIFSRTTLSLRKLT